MNRSLEKYINSENIKDFTKRLEACADERQQHTLRKLLAEEIAKSQKLRKDKAAEKAQEVRGKGTRP